MSLLFVLFALAQKELPVLFGESKKAFASRIGQSTNRMGALRAKKLSVQKTARLRAAVQGMQKAEYAASLEGLAGMKPLEPTQFPGLRRGSRLFALAQKELSVLSGKVKKFLFQGSGEASNERALFKQKKLSAQKETARFRAAVLVMQKAEYAASLEGLAGMKPL